jgi:hypothetical protein
MAAGTNLYLTLSETVYLRASDCLHLVTALHHGFSGIYTHDRHQEIAASALGLTSLDSLKTYADILYPDHYTVDSW